MKIVVAVKQVPASESKISLTNGAVDYSNISYVVNPYDEFAVEEGLRIKERTDDAEVVVISMGPQRVVDSLRTCLAMGADRAVHIDTGEHNADIIGFADSFAVAELLAGAIKKEEPDIVLVGKQAIDDDSGAVGIQVATLLGMPHVAAINKLETADGKAVANRQVETGTEVVEVHLPALFTCQKELNEPRYASLPGIMKAKSKPLDTLSLEDLGFEEGQVGAGNTVSSLAPPPERTSGRMIEGEPQEAVAELVRLLREDAGVI